MSLDDLTQDEGSCQVCLALFQGFGAAVLDVPCSVCDPTPKETTMPALTDPNPKYPLTDELLADINNRFTYHPVKQGQQERYVALREEARSLAISICANVPPGRERSSALTKLEESVMHANAGIARSGE